LRVLSFILFIALLQFPILSFSQQSVEHLLIRDTIKNKAIVETKNLKSINQVVDANYLLDANSSSIAFSQQEHINNSVQSLFYFIVSLFLLLGLLKVAFNKYFNNMIRVFFNTSLRQSQLSDQLLLAKLPSLLFNILFFIIAGSYVFLLINEIKSIQESYWQSLFYCIVCFLIIYLIKYIVLLISGWLTGYRQEAENYIFIVFLSNKVLSFFLLPMIAIIAFADSDVSYVVKILSYIAIAFMVLLRYTRAFGVLNHNLSITRFHFFLYIIGVEILPIFLIYKTLMVFINKSL